MTEVYTTEQVKACDRELARYQEELYKAHIRRDYATERIYRAAGAQLVSRGRNKYWGVRQPGGGWKYSPISWTDALDKAREKAAGEDVSSDYARRYAAATNALQDFHEASQEIDELSTRIAEKNNEWWEHGQWSRFFLVQDGHIHSSTNCHSLYPTTQIGWLPELSGETEKDAVDEHGALLCTFCFPSAPVEWTVGKQDDDTCPSRSPGRTRGRYGACAECGYVGALTQHGSMRKHKRAKEEEES